MVGEKRQKTLPRKLKLIAESINHTMREAKKIEELAVQEEVLVQLDKISVAGKSQGMTEERFRATLFAGRGQCLSL